jgi:transposase
MAMEARRFEAMAMFTDGASQGEVARVLKVSRTSSCRWKARMVAGGMVAREAPGRPCRLSGEQLRSLYALWETQEERFWTTASFADAIFEAVGVKYDPDHVGRLMRKLGLREKRVYGHAGQMELVEELAGGSACPTMATEARA